MVRFLNLIATEPEIARVPIMVDSSKWTVLEAGSMRPGQGRLQLDQPQGRRGVIPRAGPPRPRIRRAAVVMAFDELGRPTPSSARWRFAAAPTSSHREGRLRARRHHLRPQHPPDADRHRRALRLRENFIDATREIKKRFPASESQARFPT